MTHESHDISPHSDCCTACGFPSSSPAAHRPCVPSTDCDPVELRRIELECRE